MMATTDTPPEGFSDSDQQWFDRLSGKAGLTDDARAVREADALRFALDQEHQRVTREVDSKADDEVLAHDWERLQFALKREGLLQPPRRAHWTWHALGGLAAVVLLSAVLVPLWSTLDRSVYPEPPVLRGGSPVRQIASSKPRESAEQFAQALQKAGLAPALYQQNKAFVVDIALQFDQLDRATSAFMSLNLAPAQGLNRIVFDRP